MFNKTRISTIILNSLLTITSLLSIIIIIIVTWKYMIDESYIKWNIIVMVVIVCVGGIISLVTGILGIIGSIIQNKVMLIVTLISVILSCAVITFMGLYSISGVVYTEDTLEVGWNKMSIEEITAFEKKWNCHDFMFTNPTNTNIDSSNDIQLITIEQSLSEFDESDDNDSNNEITYCVDILNKPFKTYSSIMFTFSIIMYTILVISIIVLSKLIVKEENNGFEQLQ